MSFIRTNFTPKAGTDESPNGAIESQQGFPELGFFDRIEKSFAAIATQHKLQHRRLLALNWAARYHGIPAGTFQKSCELWLESEIAGGKAE